jgi:prepilin-type N-terminal cleavage/methylation domain-containing protein
MRMRTQRSRGERGFTLIEVLVAAVLLAVAVGALLSNLSVSTGNLFRTSDIDRLTFLSKRKMDELLSVQNLPRGGVIEGALQMDAAQKRATAGYRALILTASPMGQTTREQLERVRLETWIESGNRRRTMQLESYRMVRVP